MIIGGPSIYRDALARLIDGHEPMTVVGTAADVADASILIERLAPQIILVNLDSVADRGALALIRRLDPMLRVVVIGVENSEAGVAACAEAGVVGYLSRDTTADELLDALERAAGGEVVCPPRIVETLIRCYSLRSPRPLDAVPDGLTRREHQVVELIGLGLSNKQIAQRLCIEIATVKSHVHSILAKLNVERRTEAVARLNDYSMNGNGR